jgi:AAA+ superfamily predicted ATPase
VNRTGWPPGLLQDDSRELSRWFASRIDARRCVRGNLREIDLNIYGQRDHEAQGTYYLKHIDAMTRENLYSKSAIAGELAHRDIEIDVLTNALWKACGDNEELVNDYIASQR